MRRRVYLLKEAADLTGLEVSSLRRRADRGLSLRGWRPDDPVNPTDMWLLDASDVDRIVRGRTRATHISADSGHLINLHDGDEPEDPDTSERAPLDRGMGLEMENRALEAEIAQMKLERAEAERDRLHAELESVKQAYRDLLASVQRSLGASSS